MEFVARFLGRRLVYTYEVVELVADERLVMRTAQGPFPMETTYEWSDATGGGTLMRLRNRGEPAGFSRAVAPLMARAMERATSGDLRVLKRLLESDARPDGSSANVEPWAQDVGVTSLGRQLLSKNAAVGLYTRRITKKPFAGSV